MNSSNIIQILGDLEKEVMEVVWESNGVVTVRDVFEKINKNRKVAYTTVMTIMGRLVEKGLLKRKASGKAYNYQASYTKDTFLTKATRQIIKNFVASFGDTAVVHFAQEIEKIPTDKRRKLLKMLKDAK